MGRRISTATAVSEVWDSHQATLHRPCCVQKGGSKTGVWNKITKSIKVSWYQLVVLETLVALPILSIQSEMILSHQRLFWWIGNSPPCAKKSPGFRRWIWWDLWRPLPGDPFGFDRPWFCFKTLIYRCSRCCSQQIAVLKLYYRY